MACDQCSELRGKIIGLGETYLEKGGNINGVVFDYEDVVSPPLHPNCECDLAPVFIPTKGLGKKK